MRHFHFMAALVALLVSTASAKVTLQVNYSLDSTNFFNSNGNPQWQAARAAFEFAARTYSDRLMDNLTEVKSVYDGFNGGEWQPQVTHPGNGVEMYVPSITTVPANVYVLYPGARSLAPGTLAVGGPAYYALGYYPTVPASVDWANNVRCRGQMGALDNSPTDFGPWGGTVSFNTGTTWHYGLTTAGLSGKTDFLTVALHEIGHALGFGTAPSFKAWAGNGVFYGNKTTEVYGGGGVPVDELVAHWTEGVQSTVAGLIQDAAMTPSVAPGVRKKLTLLDWAAIDDTGWQIARPGDANADGSINFSDLATVAQNYNSTGMTWSQGDFNYDETVNFQDLVVVAQNYNTTSAADIAGASADFGADWDRALAETQAVPEPAVGVFVIVGLLLTQRARRSWSA